MIYLFDSNVCIHFLRKKGNALVKKRIATQPFADVALCSVVEGELLFGAENSAQPTASKVTLAAFTGLFIIVLYDSGSAVEYAWIRAHLQRIGLPIGPYDMMIAAIAIQHNLTLVTHNTSEFTRVPGLKLVDWELP